MGIAGRLRSVVKGWSDQSVKAQTKGGHVSGFVEYYIGSGGRMVWIRRKVQECRSRVRKRWARDDVM